MLLRSRKGLSNITEYVVLVSVVAGAAVSMQHYVKGRLQGATKTASDDYEAVLGGGTYEPVRTTRSDSTTRMNMSDADSGAVTSDSAGRVDLTK